MIRADLRKQSGLLTQAIETCTQQALACGALQPIETTQSLLRDGAIEFLIRSVTSLQRKAQTSGEPKKQQDRPVNPFLPPEPELTVADVSDTHLAILNKFNVIDRHLLLVTRRFEEQESLLSDADFFAWWRCLREIDGLGFYNGGKVAGASQRHKHLQLIPLPLAANISGTPMDVIWPQTSEPGELSCLPELPIPHLFSLLPAIDQDEIDTAAAISRSIYRRMLTRLKIEPVSSHAGAYQSAPYNLLLTRRWMLMVPRFRESCAGISINALGFAGSLFVPDRADIDRVKLIGPMNILKAVTEP